ncbi:MAG TPA: hypothetical protein ENO39_04865 [Fervidicoccus fontis]|uniref:Uncharacterized protein n=1 Tax=Fervidicoccus fontis TaxID=683846 RepID=A0A7C2VFI4_9CREN|nr:hypothetical protein [Fervidicoccus fontis]
MVRDFLKEKYECVVCGKVFYEGQGIRIKREGLQLDFHSSRCAALFFKRLIEESPSAECVSETAKKLIDEFKELREKRSKKHI